MLPALGTTMTRLTAKALMYLVLAPGSDQLPSHTPLRRAGIDLIGIVSCFFGRHHIFFTRQCVKETTLRCGADA